MSWHVAEPAGTKTINELTIYMPANWAYLAAALSAGHTFPGTYGTTAGKHLVGQVRVFFYGTTADIIALSSPPTGAMAYDTDLFRLKRYNGTAWVEFTNLVHRQNGYMKGNLVVTGSIMDGRDPSADGVILDTVAASATAVGTNMDINIGNNKTIAKPTLPASVTWENSACNFIATARNWTNVCNTRISNAGKVTTSTSAIAFVVAAK